MSANKTPNSFHELFGKAETGSLSTDQQYIRLIQKCDWFKETKNIRDSIEHYAAEIAMCSELQLTGIYVSGN